MQQLGSWGGGGVYVGCLVLGVALQCQAPPLPCGGRASWHNRGARTGGGDILGSLDKRLTGSGAFGDPFRKVGVSTSKWKLGVMGCRLPARES